MEHVVLGISDFGDESVLAFAEKHPEEVPDEIVDVEGHTVRSGQDGRIGVDQPDLVLVTCQNVGPDCAHK
jgi:hypothetical protein